MTIDNHRAVGDELKRLASSQTPDRAHKNIEAIRAGLENWLFAEASRDNRNLTNNQLNIYYSGEAVKGYRTAEEKLAALDQVRTILTGSYPDSKPLRDILKRLTTARSAVIKNLAR